MLLPSQPYRYYILFNDLQVEEEMRSIWQAIESEWSRIRVSDQSQPTINGMRMYPIGSSSNETSAESPAGGSLGSLWEDHVVKVLDDFAQTDTFVQAAAKIDRLCYLDPGDYELEMVVRTARPERSFRQAWTFRLSEEDSNGIRQNGVSVLREVCRLPSHYRTAYADYQPGRTSVPDSLVP